MARFSLNPLTRGIKLTRSAWALYSSIATALTVPSISRDNYKQPNGTFRLDFVVPVFDCRAVGNFVFSDGNKAQTPALCIPFTLPPLQEFFSTTRNVDPTTPIPILQEVSVSFDQRAEAAGISADYTGATEGRINGNVVRQYNLRMSLQEKVMGVTGAGGAFDPPPSRSPQRDVFSADIPFDAFSGFARRDNPFFIGGLSKEIHPYRSYLLQLQANDMNTGVVVSDFGCLVSVVLSLTFRHPIVARDSGAALVQNIPTIHNGTKTGNVFTQFLPALAGFIEADIGAGVQFQFRRLDALLRASLDGGYTKDSDRPVSEFTSDDSCYTVVAVPTWTNFGSGGCVTSPGAGAGALQLPGAGVQPCIGMTIDRRFIPITYPMVIHHVIAAINYAGLPGVALHPESATFSHHIGVGIGRGLRGDDFAYQPVAFRTWLTGNAVGARRDSCLDEIKQIVGGVMTMPSPTYTSAWDFELFAIPLVRDGVADGVGYTPQGHPFYVGKATSKTQARSNCGNNAGASVVPTTGGAEQWIEVRHGLQDTIGLATTAAGGAVGNVAATTYSGFAGSWVFLVGKKTLARIDGDIPV